MRVLLVCSYSFKNGQTGDATQGRETARALAGVGVDLVQVYVKYLPVRIYDAEDNELAYSDIAALVEACDVVHLLPGTITLCRFWRQFHTRPLLVSSIYWGGLERVRIAFNNNHGLLYKAKCAAKELRNMLPLYMDYRGVDIFLPNSDAEGKCLMRYFRTDKGSSYKAVPNGFLPPEFNVRNLSRSERVPKEDYVVVPGVFARRKNQIGLIRALRKYSRDYKIVFLGGALDKEYYDECVSAATESMSFLGYVSSKSIEYWKILGHARVACLASDCETPGIAMIESAYAGARPVITKYGGTSEYFGKYGEYLNPCSPASIVAALDRGWNRGRLDSNEADNFAHFTWDLVAERTISAYESAKQMFPERP